jgi:hypothetical protein
VWQFVLTSTVDNLSPMIDSTRCSAILITNRIDFVIDGTTPPTNPAGAAPPYVAETAASGATNSARYITKPVVLAQPANSIHFYLNIIWPPQAQVDVYYKILPTNTNDTFASQDYVLMTPDPGTSFSPSQSPSQVNQYYWWDNNIGDFTTFAIKVVMRSTSSSNVPQCSSLRAIALEM